MRNITNISAAPEDSTDGDAKAYSHSWRVLTPAMREMGGTLGVVQNRLAPGNTACPFHWHLKEDEVFLIQEGRGIFRYGDELQEVGPGDCISCPAGTETAHQIANPFSQDLVYLAIGVRDPNEVCGYPDSEKIMVRAVGKVGTFTPTDYKHGESLESPKIFQLIQDSGASG